MTVRSERPFSLHGSRTGYVIDLSGVRTGVRVFGPITPLSANRVCVFGSDRTPNTTPVSICAFNKTAEHLPNTVRKTFGRTDKPNILAELSS